MDMEKGYIKRLTKEEAAAPVTRKWQPEETFQGSSLNSHLLSGPDIYIYFLIHTWDFFI